MKKEKTFKEKIVDKCWYKICYADGLKEKDKWKYAEAMGEEILALFEEELKDKLRITENTMVMLRHELDKK